VPPLNLPKFLTLISSKGEEDKKNIQLLKAALNELHSLLMDRKDYPIGAYIHE
jgi:hypothetical protein